MLEILSTSIENNATNVLLDSVIELTFNQEVEDSSINTDNFKLYVNDGGNYTSLKTIIINKDTSAPAILTISPSGDLAQSTTYLLFIQGDMNISDAVIQGITAVSNETMDKNYLLEFTTGTEVSDPDPLEPVVYTPADDGSSNTTTTTTASTANAVVSTTPYNGQADIATLDEIEIIFNRSLSNPAIVTSMLTIETESADWPYDTIPTEYQASGFLLGTPVLSNTNKTVTYPVDLTHQDLPDNTLYLVTIDKDIGDTVTGSGSLPTDYVWYFSSKYSPAYAHPRQIRQETGTLFNDVPDGIIWYLIHESSLLLEEKTGLSWDDNASVPYYANRYVKCMTILKLYNTISGEVIGAGSIIEKRLGDLTIKYSEGSSDSNSTVPSWVEDCIEKSLAELLGGRTQPKTIVKSEYGHKYPGRRRSTI